MKIPKIFQLQLLIKALFYIQTIFFFFLGYNYYVEALIQEAILKKLYQIEPSCSATSMLFSSCKLSWLIMIEPKYK